MKTVADQAQAFASAAKEGRKVRATVDKRHAASFLQMLAREGLAIARDGLELITDPELRRIVETVLGSTLSGAVLGGAVGMAFGAPEVGAVVGAGVGLVAGVFAVVVTLSQRDGRLVVAVG